jgi:phosphoribosylformimino-5-aminoimidazole carboxamide ribotide isomerase
MVIPCIDLMGGKVVQLVRGEEKALELESTDQAVDMFKSFPLLHIIDLDAALGRGHNRNLVKDLLTKVRARVGGGIRTVDDARALVGLGADQVIVGTSAFSADGINAGFLEELRDAVGLAKVIVAIDVKGGKIAVRGWQSTLASTPAELLPLLEPYCDGFLCTYVDREGMLAGTDLDLFLGLRAMTSRKLIAAGGITTMEEVQALVAADVQVALGMSVYTGMLSLSALSSMGTRSG